jgi:two-component system, chemotaxis family, protein-glutamate methylesterase/glutaminase
MTQKIRVLVVEDSLTARKHLVSVLNADPGLVVIGEAEDGKRAIELCRALRPDVVTLDMMLPLLSGVAVTEYIMAYCPTPILVVSSSINRGELYKTYDALAAGAVDVFEKPSGRGPDGAWERGLIAAVKIASRIHVITHVRGKLAALHHVNGGGQAVGQIAGHATGHAAGATGGHPGSHLGSHLGGLGSAHRTLVAIGASTGGPAAIVDILRELPQNFPLPILLVIHIGEPFSSAFAEWLDGQSKLRVRYARDGEAIPARGTPGVLMAPAGAHLVAQNGHLWLKASAERNSCRPSIDVLFESLARPHGAETVACLLTGMGKDGAAGLLALRLAGALTLAQDELSSVIFGMPREAIEMGAANRVLPLNQFSAALVDAVCEPKLRGAL